MESVRGTWGRIVAAVAVIGAGACGGEAVEVDRVEGELSASAVDGLALSRPSAAERVAEIGARAASPEGWGAQVVRSREEVMAGLKGVSTRITTVSECFIDDQCPRPWDGWAECAPDEQAVPVCVAHVCGGMCRRSCFSDCDCESTESCARPPIPTSRVHLAVTLGRSLGFPLVVEVPVWSADGTMHWLAINLDVDRNASATWRWRALFGDGEPGVTGLAPPYIIASGTLVFDTTGHLTSETVDPPVHVNLDGSPLAVGLSFEGSTEEDGEWFSYALSSNGRGLGTCAAASIQPNRCGG